MYQRAEAISPKKHLLIQGSVWFVVAVIFVLRIGPATGDEAYPTCPSVLDSVFYSDGYPLTLAGLAAAVVAVGIGWFLTGLLMLAYTRWPRYFLRLRVVVSKKGAPVAWRAGLVTMSAGGLLLGALQAGC